jgi:MFS superfamily sulfate permease-like transporter
MDRGTAYGNGEQGGEGVRAEAEADIEGGGRMVIIEMTSSLFFVNCAAVKAAVRDAAEVLSGAAAAYAADASEGGGGAECGYGRSSRSDRPLTAGEGEEEKALVSTPSVTAPAAASSAVVLDASCWGAYIDVPSTQALEDLTVALKSIDPPVHLGLVGVHKGVRDILERAGVMKKIGQEFIFKEQGQCWRTCPGALDGIGIGIGVGILKGKGKGKGVVKGDKDEDEDEDRTSINGKGKGNHYSSNSITDSALVDVRVDTGESI